MAFFKNMAASLPGQASHDEHSSTSEASLTTILPTSSSRADLTLLLATITDTMRASLNSSFLPGDPNALDPTLQDPSTFTSPYASPSLEKPRSRPSSQSTKPPGATKQDDRAWVDAVKADIVAQEKVRTELEKRAKELSGEKVQEMKRTALEQFDKWRERVLERVGEVLNARSEEAKDDAKTDVDKGQVHVDEKARGQIEDVKDPPEVQAAFKLNYPPTETGLLQLERAKRVLVLHSMLLLLLSLEHYSSWSRTLLVYLTTSLDLPIRILEEDEAKIATGLLEAVDMSGDTSAKKAAEENASARKWKVGLATVAGATIVGLTGGLAAPLLAAGVGSVMGGLGLGATAAAGYLGTLAGSSILVGGLFGAYGGRMTGEMVDSYARDVEDFAFIPVPSAGTPSAATGKDVPKTRRLRVTVGISGWLSTAEDVTTPWKVLGHTSSETFALRFELSALIALGSALTSLLKSAAWNYARSEIIKRTVFASLTAALWPLALLKVSRLIDNPFSVAKSRAEKAGEVLADAIINKAQGERPVTLIGYSLGARVIYVCLKKMAERGAFGLVEDVVVMGAPTPSDTLDWRIVRAVASGRVLNVYSTEDYILGFLYRSSSVQLGVAGLQAVRDVPGVENVDFSAEVQGHNSWRWLVGKVLKRVGMSDVVAAEAQRQEVEGRKVKKEEEETREREDKTGGSDGGDDEVHQDETKDSGDAEVASMQAQIDEGHRQAITQAKPHGNEAKEGHQA